ncbi:Uncharacterised protein r2_g1889 [Pycnogonum litorale]
MFFFLHSCHSDLERTIDTVLVITSTPSDESVWVKRIYKILFTLAAVLKSFVQTVAQFNGFGVCLHKRRY